MEMDLFRVLSSDDRKDFQNRADLFYDENIKQIVKSAQVWHPVYRKVLLDRFTQDVSMGDF